MLFVTWTADYMQRIYAYFKARAFGAAMFFDSLASDYPHLDYRRARADWAGTVIHTCMTLCHAERFDQYQVRVEGLAPCEAGRRGAVVGSL